jgi:hypothetical protein
VARSPFAKRGSKTQTRKWRALGFDHVDWQVALAHYESERLAEALDAALESGMGQAGQYLSLFRTIEAEALTAARSKVVPLNETLEMEWIEEEVGPYDDWIAERIAVSTGSVGERFAYSHESRVRFTVLAQQTDAPWLFGRYGYCTPKTPFYKICMPLGIVGDEAEFGRTIRHEYAHVVVGTLSERRAPRWLEEAVAMLAEGGVPRREARRFAEGEEEWLGPAEVSADLGEHGESEEKWLAYMQAGLVGMYLAHVGGEESVARMLRGFADHSPWKEMWLRIRGLSPEEEAVRQVYGVGLRELFRRAGEWVRAFRG